MKILVLYLPYLVGTILMNAALAYSLHIIHNMMGKPRNLMGVYIKSIIPVLLLHLLQLLLLGEINSQSPVLLRSFHWWLSNNMTAYMYATTLLSVAAAYLLGNYISEVEQPH